MTINKMLATVLAMLLATWPVMSQQAQVPATTVTNNTLQHSVVATMYANGSAIVPISNGAVMHQVVVKSGSSVTAATVTVYASVAGNVNFNQVGSLTTLNGLITFNGQADFVKISVTNYAGSGPVDFDYFGNSAISSITNLAGGQFNTPIGAVADALKVNVQGQLTVVNGVILNDYAGPGLTVTGIATTGTFTTFATGTTYVTMGRCFNTTSGSLNFWRQDTAGNAYEVSFAIAANSNYYWESPGSFTKMVGIKLTASGSGLNCNMTGKQQ